MNIFLKHFVFEYEVVSTDTDGQTYRFSYQKEVRAKHLQGAIRKLYLEAEPGFAGLTKIVWENT